MNNFAAAGDLAMSIGVLGTNERRETLTRRASPATLSRKSGRGELVPLHRDYDCLSEGWG